MQSREPKQGQRAVGNEGPSSRGIRQRTPTNMEAQSGHGPTQAAAAQPLLPEELVWGFYSPVNYL
jgi:hypothetical protein